MLSPTQKNFSEEDVSGSNAASEASVEPETDRFGFILTNGSVAGSTGPPPELVRQRETKWINIISQWDCMLLKKTNKVKEQSQKGIPASLRAKCWPLLCAASDRKEQNQNLYKTLDSLPALQSWVDVIERDLGRQFPFHEMFLCKDGHGQRGLFRVLKAYTQYQPEEGYCQAQGPVAAVLLMNMPAEEAFWCLVQISEQYLPGYYSPLLEGVLFDAGMLTWVLRRTCSAAHKHLQHHGVEPLMFATDWLMCLFTRHLPFNTLLRVWDLFFCYGVRVLLQVAAVLVRRVLGRAEQRKACQGQMETLERLRGVREQVHEEDDAFIAEVCSVPLSARDLEKQTEKELAKWRRERPSSTFDPRGRCQGYRMAWAKAMQNSQDQDRKAREKGNLSVPLSRSASILSLSPSLFRRRLRKGSKVNEGRDEAKNVRHLSVGAKEDWGEGLNELHSENEQGVEEEKEPTGSSEEKELTEKTDEDQNVQAEQIEKTEVVKEPNKQGDSDKMEDNQHKHIQDKEMVSGQKEHQKETESNPDPMNVNIFPSTASQYEQREEASSKSQSHVPEKQNHKDEEQETGAQVSENGDVAAVEENQCETHKDSVEDTNTDEYGDVHTSSGEDQVIQADLKPEEGTVCEPVDTGGGVFETHGNIEAAAFTIPTLDTEEESGRSDYNSPSEFGGETHNAASLVRTERKEESSCQTETETNERVEERPAEQIETKTDERVVKSLDTQTETGANVTERAIEQIQTETDEKVEEKAIEQIQTETDEKVEEKAIKQIQTETDEKVEEKAIEQIHKETGENVTERAIEQIQIETDEKVEEKAIEQIQRETDEKVEEKAIEQIQRETDEKVEEKAIEQIQRETDEKVEEKAIEQIQRETDEKVEEKAIEQIQRETDEKVEERAIEQIQTKTDEKVEERDSTQNEWDAKTVQTVSKDPTEAEPSILSLPECVQQQEAADTMMDLVREEIKEESSSLTETDEKVEESAAAQNELKTETVQNDSETLISPSAECVQHQEASDAAVDTDNTVKELSMVRTHCSEEECESAAARHTMGKGAETEQKDETQTGTSDSVEGAANLPEAVNLITEHDGEMSSVEEPVHEELTNRVTGESPEAKENSENENKPGEKDVFTCTKTEGQAKDGVPVDQNKCSQTQKSSCRRSQSSGDVCDRTSSSSRRSRLARKLSEDLFTVPQRTSQSPSVADHVEVKHVENTKQHSPEDTRSSQSTSSDVTQEMAVEKEQLPAPKRFGLFRILRGEQSKKTKQKMLVPKILIQDFSDGTGKLVEDKGEEKLSSRERRRRRREKERQEKEEEKLRKKKEKETEKERERRKPQTRGKSFQVQTKKDSGDTPQLTKTGSQKLRFFNSYAESYF